MSPPVIDLAEINCFSRLPRCRELQGFRLSQCVWKRALIHAARVYFAIGIINIFIVVVTLAIFVYYGRPPSTAEDHTKESWYARLFSYKVGLNKGHDTLAHQMRAHGLQRRGLLTTSVISIGYLIFSTGMYAYQCFYRPEACNIMFWGVLIGFVTYMFAITWSSYRLTFLSRLSVLKDRFATGNCGDGQDLRWFLQNRDLHAISSRRFLVFYSGLLVVLLACGACIQIWASHTIGLNCKYAWGNYVLLSLSCFYFAVLLPLVAWSVRNCKDLHGVRNQFFVMFLIGIPFFVMYVIWIATFNPQDADSPSRVRYIFPAGNWIVLMTAASHGTLVCWPLVKYTLWAHRMQESAAAPRAHSPLSMSIFRCSTPELERRRPANQATHTGHAPQASVMSSLRGIYDGLWNHGQGQELVLQPECLDAILRDPMQRKRLHDMAVKDFSVENILFYEQYLQLEQEMQAFVEKKPSSSRPAPLVIPTPPQPAASPVSFTSHSSQESVPTLSDFEVDTNDNGAPTGNTSKSRRRAPKTFQAPQIFVQHWSPTPRRQNKKRPLRRKAELLEEPIPEELKPLCEEIYRTFIPDWAPLQINISHKARKQLERVFAEKCQSTDGSTDSDATRWLTHPSSASSPHENHLLLPLPPGHRQRFGSNETLSSGHSTATPEILSPDSRSRFTDEARPRQNRERSPRVTLASFELARQEVFSNIFTSIFPKLVHQN
ncbi:hypothetical protein BCR43DRAFT_517493 [Syncephalastrum racemosum]|uniref:RGS domain-containing protein n=1 Tax=Syncephalastrum racemosum TaxID=13706 RepID=A0A1X2H4B9_SYNRA|nr:hypothetical protein BCR43DRAFT_517493 [Syncephalastrum racemosum]